MPLHTGFGVETATVAVQELLAATAANSPAPINRKLSGHRTAEPSPSHSTPNPTNGHIGCCLPHAPPRIALRRASPAPRSLLRCGRGGAARSLPEATRGGGSGGGANQRVLLFSRVLPNIWLVIQCLVEMSMPMYNKQNSMGTPPVHRTNPFDSDSDSDVPSRPSRAQSVPVQRTNQSVQELEDYAITKARETTHKVNDCVRAAEAIREDATQTLRTLHRQGEQIMQSHQLAADIERDLTVSEKLLGSLGGLFSKAWRPKRNQHIKGPVSENNYSARTANDSEQRWRLGIAPTRQESPSPVQTTPSTVMGKIQAEKSKKDDALSDLSNTLGQLKEMAVDMGTEIDRQNKALLPFSDDVDELNFRLKGANQRGRRLLGK